jgi:hypothetical protein
MRIHTFLGLLLFAVESRSSEYAWITTIASVDNVLKEIGVLITHLLLKFISEN